MQHFAKLEVIAWLDGMRSIPVDIPLPDTIIDNALALVQRNWELDKLNLQHRISELEYELEVASRCRNKTKKWRLFK